MTAANAFIDLYLPVLLKLVVISLYFVIIFVFFDRARKKEESAKFEILIGLFFAFMSTGAIIEVISKNFFPNFYLGDSYWGYPTIYGEVLVYFFGFIGIALFTLGTELKVKLKTHGLLSLFAFFLAAITLIIGMGIANYIYFLGLVIVIVPLVYFYIAYKATEDTRKRAFVLAIGYFLFLMAEGNNYNLIQHVDALNALTLYLQSLLGFSAAFLGPLLSIFGLLLIFYGYKIFFK
ncbi:MAG: hypothetical protein LUQ65_14560 [Candidatus Helarchaeota archaeon]|nr:hypothetical protein [Candidatus Helarchaeota archaeon]